MKDDKPCPKCGERSPHPMHDKYQHPPTTLREEVIYLRELVNASVPSTPYNAILKFDRAKFNRLLDFHDKAVEALRYVSENIDCEPEWDIAKVAERALALLDKEVE